MWNPAQVIALAGRKEKQMTRKVILVMILVVWNSLAGAAYHKIVTAQDCPRAIQSAARILSGNMKLSVQDIVTGTDAVAIEGEIVLATLPLQGQQARRLDAAAKQIKDDGYVIVFHSAGATICGARPRSLLYAAADWHLWKDKTDGIYVRNPSFAIRVAQYEGSLPADEYIAVLGVNMLIDRKPGKDVLQACHDADVPYSVFLYGNNYQKWSSRRYDAAVGSMPSIAGTPAANSWEKATLCPSDPNSWTLIEGYVKEFLERSGADGLYATFWDDYGIYCQCDRCVKSGMNQFPNQLYECVKHYYNVTSAMNKKLVIRTWSSGVPHWLRDEWVHAPGYDHFGGSGLDIWGRVIRELPKDIILQTKVYHADCQPDARFSTLLGHASPHTEIAEYQITGQTTGRFYFPASTVNHTAWTMKQCLKLNGANSGVCLFLGGTKQIDYSLLNDIANSINVYAWRELSWDIHVNLDTVWKDWAEPIYGVKAAPHIIKALQLSEDAVNKTFSTLGMGSETNSSFAGGIARRETLLKYTNRYFLPEFAKYLEPTKENIQRVIDEKNECLKKIDTIFSELQAAKPDLTESQFGELQTRFDWLKEYAINARYLDESLWRYRYLRYLYSMRTTEPEQMKYLAAAYDAAEEHGKKLFQFQPEQQFSCYSVSLGQLRTRPGLGNPMSLMKELYAQSKIFVEDNVGPDYLPAEWKR
jgi:hypothetical protein